MDSLPRIGTAKIRQQSRCDARTDESDDSTSCCHAVHEGPTGGRSPKVQENWPDAEVPYGSGHAARRQFGGQYPVWGPELEAKLKQEWISYQDQIAHGWASVRYFVRRGYEYKIPFP